MIQREQVSSFDGKKKQSNVRHIPFNINDARLVLLMTVLTRGRPKSYTFAFIILRVQCP